MEVIYEIIGYTGTAFVLLSMMMTSVKKLRIFNLCGAVLSAFYALMTNAMPVAALNLCLTVINLVQLYRLRNKKEES